MDKKTLRTKYLAFRHELLAKNSKNKDIADHAISLLHDARYIGIYASFNDEVDTSLIFQTFKDKCCFPKVEDTTMSFYKIDDLAQLQVGRYGILEPVLPREAIASSLLDVIIIPCIAINKKGYRLGYGKGYYDRYLQGYSGIKIALVYHELVIDEDFQEAHDISVDIYVDETGITKLKK
ncbi:MAG: 5-formyltetrahydrofolate cyclo-ligase [Erysipelotrichaceae bacterium]|nr:5-formyltetrahydrofolate cyclo-ligase [Erysipelotrichaceae bacterium]MDY5251839.1 5-formyltetrahydrofolate cyclo-ligase [Erysipelotrichaceae bacterium]